jgi:type II secretory pathway pseudopilin PulG
MRRLAHPRLPHSARVARAGLTLVETAAIVSVIGTLLAVAIPALAKAVRASKVSEASEQLETLYQSVAAYYALPRTLPSSAAPVHCLPDAAGPMPELGSMTPVQVDFGAAESHGAETWKALSFAPVVPLRYRYTFLPAASGCGDATTALVLRAEGDLDGDGVYSTFERRAEVQPGGVLQPEPVLHIQDRIE